MPDMTMIKLQIHKNSYDLNSATISWKLDKEEPVTKKASRCLLGIRHVVTLVGFLSCCLINAHRSVLSVAIVAMAKHGQKKEMYHRNESENTCPLPSNSSNLDVDSNFQGEFDWSTELQGYVLGSGILSYLTTQILAGRLTDAVGAKYILVFSNAVAGILTFISPFAARWHVYVLMAVQFLKGAAQGFSTPPIYKLISNWIPRNERGTLSTLIVTGYAAGAAVTGIATGWLCDTPGFEWPSAFYALGIISVLISVVFHFIFYEHPENHPWISDEEINHITDGLESKVPIKPPPTPWKKMFTSIPSYAYFYGLFGHYWGLAYFIIVHPSFLGTVLHYDMTKNGVISSLLILIQSVGGVSASIASYWISKKNLIGLSKLRKTTTFMGALGFSLCMTGILLAGCDTFINILCCTLSLFCNGIALSGIIIAGVDMAPAFAGSIMGVASTIAGSAFFFIPVITGLVTTDETLSEWQIVFWINVVVVGSSGLVYVLFGSADVQPWNNTEDEHIDDVATKKRTQSDKNIKEIIDMKCRRVPGSKPDSIE